MIDNKKSTLRMLMIPTIIISLNYPSIVIPNNNDLKRILKDKNYDTINLIIVSSKSEKPSNTIKSKELSGLSEQGRQQVLSFQIQQKKLTVSFQNTMMEWMGLSKTTSIAEKAFIPDHDFLLWVINNRKDLKNCSTMLHPKEIQKGTINSETNWTVTFYQINYSPGILCL
uniref:Uncharacterized protein n=2 Tax=Clastoptera arizonana TaxID=38151 RepID=A0A1B6DUT9_9HEMI